MCLDGLPDGAFTMDARAQPNLGGHRCQCHDRCHLVCYMYYGQAFYVWFFI